MNRKLSLLTEALVANFKEKLNLNVILPTFVIHSKPTQSSTFLTTIVLLLILFIKFSTWDTYVSSSAVSNGLKF